MPSQYMVIEATKSFDGDRFPVAERELRIIRYGYDNPGFIPRLVSQVRSSKSIEWGGAVVSSDGYHIVFDGKGPLPAEVTARLPHNVS